MKNGLTVIALSALLTAGGAFAADKESATQLTADAEAAFKRVAKDTGYQWTSTEGAIKAAKKAIEAGKFDEAEAKAKLAMDMVKATETQAKIEADTWTMRVPK
jgi:TPP-dependent trihydroxycyclohexane-1,2-dione (THcHDO) dehydratase